MEERRRRLLYASLFMSAIFSAAVAAFYALGRGDWSIMDCVYMTAMTVTTVGYSEVLPVSQVAGGRLVTVAIMFAGVSALLYFASTVMAFLVEGDLRDLLGSRRMEKRTRKMRDHYIVCGVGRTGRHTVTQLVEAGHPVVVVEQDETRVREFFDQRGLDLPYIIGDATDETTLSRAGIERAKGLACALDSDQSNLYTVLTAREANRDLRIAAKASGHPAATKLKLVGANSVVAPTELGGRRLFAEMTRPAAAAFLESLLMPSNLDLTVMEIRVTAQSPLAGKTLAESDLRRQVGNVLILGIKPPDKTEFEYNPKHTSQLIAGCMVMALGAPREVEALRAMADQ